MDGGSRHDLGDGKEGAAITAFATLRGRGSFGRSTETSEVALLALGVKGAWAADRRADVVKPAPWGVFASPQQAG